MARQYLDVTEAEDLALQALYTATTGASWTDKTGWDGATAGDCTGVTEAGGVVTALDLRANNLVGEFTAAVVSALTSCTTIHVEGNPSLNVSFDLDDLPASVTDFVADYTDSDLAGGSSAMSAVDIEEISIRSASLSSLSVADIIDRIYADRGNFNHPTPILRIDNLEDETLAYLATHGVSRTSAEIAAIDVNIKAIKAGTPVVLSSLTAKLSTIDGTAFVTQSSVDLRPYIGFKFSFNDGSQALVGWAKAYGTGETLGSELVTNGDFSAWTGDNPNGWSVAEVGDATSNVTENPAGKCNIISDGTFTAVYQAPLASSRLYKLTCVVDSLTGQIYFGQSVAPAWTSVISAAGATTLYGTCAAASQNRVLAARQAGAPCNAVVSLVSAKQVLTPDTSGLTIVSASGGSTYNWTSDGGIAPNAASFTLTITNS